ncbi:unnamed protein product [Clonostachys solani]|uniref:Uncharacterized protein n=1 Tax=Clonostachys solani TaxID=160281 RepID=A0A9N9Z2T9_9HYPO|nr:unnamed protein product [Clonostachys solani]
MAEVEWAGRSNKAARRIEEKGSPQGRANYKPQRDYSDPSHFGLLPVTPYQGVERGAGRERDDGARMRVRRYLLRPPALTDGGSDQGRKAKVEV